MITQQFCTHRTVTTNGAGVVMWEGSAMAPVAPGGSWWRCHECGYTEFRGDPNQAAPIQRPHNGPTSSATARRGRRSLVCPDQGDLFHGGAA